MFLAKLTISLYLRLSLVVETQEAMGSGPVEPMGWDLNEAAAFSAVVCMLPASLLTGSPHTDGFTRRLMQRLKPKGDFGFRLYIMWDLLSEKPRLPLGETEN